MRPHYIKCEAILAENATIELVSVGGERYAAAREASRVAFARPSRFVRLWLLKFLG